MLGQISDPSMFLFEALGLGDGCDEGDGLFVRSQTRSETSLDRKLHGRFGNYIHIWFVGHRDSTSEL